jgi:DNA (cytosine-5)-methyltransferase 1
VSGAYYNEIDPKAAAWLRELIRAGHIAKGEVDERDIRDVEPQDLKGFTQCHFFAGVGVWSRALRKSGWSDSSPVWTGSCPCQPFSAAGKRGGTLDERHLWPAFHHLIRELRPSTVFGEQVASRDGIAWLDLVQADLEGEGYACGPAVLPACGVGAPHIRSRLWFVADTSSIGREEVRRRASQKVSRSGTKQELERLRHDGGVADALRTIRPEGRPEGRPESRSRSIAGSSGIGELGNASCEGGWRDAGTVFRKETEGQSQRIQARDDAYESESAGPIGRLGNAGGKGLEELGQQSTRTKLATIKRAGPVNGFWRSAQWIPCTDERARAVEPGSFPLAHGAPARVVRLRGYGNAVNAEAAKEFISAYIQVSGYTPESTAREGKGA